MKDFIVFFREPDGRTEAHPAENTASHRRNWDNWMARWAQAGHLAGGSSLTLEGTLVFGEGKIEKGIYQNGTEIVGGFLLLKAEDLAKATEITASCPIFEFGGFAEVREFQKQ